jgi:hypothetical protein
MSASEFTCTSSLKGLLINEFVSDFGTQMIRASVQEASCLILAEAVVGFVCD